MSQNGTGKKSKRNRPGQTTKPIDNFKDDPLNLKKDNKVKFQMGKDPIEEGVIKGFREHIKPGGRCKNIGDQIAEIVRDNGTSCFRFRQEIISKLP